ncbi:MAG: hypothetical protein IVW51_16685 [Thermaceae bacterium]|nr:hypothetical protein [Thermaceae bacterium]
MKPAQPSSLEMIRSEMARQHADALASLEVNREAVKPLVAALGGSRRLLLLGMGGSHFAGRSAEGEYRGLGLDATALALSEVLYNPLPDLPRTALITSQSGESGEVLRYLETPPRQEQRFGLTLNETSPLARSLPGLLGSGGAEVGFAATRSLTVSLALHAALLEGLGQRQNDLRAVLQHPPDPDISEAIEQLAPTQVGVFVGRSSLQGIAEMAALGLSELARMPALAFEGGQFRHGPPEMLKPSLGLVFLKAAGATSSHSNGLIKLALQAGLHPVVFDTSGEAKIAGSTHIPLPPLSGLAAATALLYPLQKLLLALAARQVERVGEPVRSSKVTREG